MRPLLGFSRPPPPAIPIEISNTDSRTVSDFASSFSANNVNIGAAAANRMIIVGIQTGQSTELSGVDSCTIGGVTATKLLSAVLPGFSFQFIDIWYAIVPTGTTATIAFTTIDTAIDPEIGVYRVLNASTTLFDSTAVFELSSAPGLAANTNTEASGGVIAFAYSSGGSHTHDWTGTTKDFEILNFSGSHHEATTTESPRSISVTDAVDDFWDALVAVVSLQAA